MRQFRSIPDPATVRGGWLRATLCAPAFLLGGCASAPNPPTEALNAAEQAITQAERARIESNASPELRQARQELAAAYDAVQQEEMIRAQRLAQQSQAAAELALSKSEAAKADAANVDLEETIDALENEIDRNAGEPQ